MGERTCRPPPGRQGHKPRGENRGAGRPLFQPDPGCDRGEYRDLLALGHENGFKALEEHFGFMAITSYRND